MKKQIFSYILLLFTVSWAIQIFAIVFTADINSDAARVWLAVAMMSPILVTLVFLKENKNLRAKLLWKPNSGIFITSFLAVLLPTLIAFAVLITIQQFNYGESGWFSVSNSGVVISEGPFLLGKGDQSWMLFTANILLTGIAFSVINAFIATGEEFAWRGLLQPLLTEQFGLFKGVTLLGFIWSMWHLPALLNGYNYPDNPMLGAFVLFPIRLIATSYFYVWLTQKSNSFIPASIAHGALNGIQVGIVSGIHMHSDPIYENVITLAWTVIAGLLFLALENKRKKKLSRSQTGADND